MNDSNIDITNNHGWHWLIFSLFSAILKHCQIKQVRGP